MRMQRMLSLALMPLAAACAGRAMSANAHTTLSPRDAADVAAHAQVSTADAGEIQQGQLALSRAQNAGVRGFAQRMVTDHAAALEMRDRRMVGIGHGLRYGTLALANAEGQNVGSASVAPNAVTLDNATSSPRADAASPNAPAFLSAAVMTPAGVTELNTVLINHPASRPMVQMSLSDVQQLEQLSGAAFDRMYMDKQVMAHQNALRTIDTLLAQGDLSAELRSILTTQRGAVAMHLQMAQQLRAQL